MSRTQNFFLFCSGADRTVLARPECSLERGKYASIGATVLLTGVFACVSGTYALGRVFHNSDWGLALALPLGAVWGLTIFNLDRLMVSGIRKSDSFWRQLVSATPRLAMAIVISLVVAKPLEVRIFEDRIEAQLDAMRIEQLALGGVQARAALKTDDIAEEVDSLERRAATARRVREEDPDTQEFRDLVERSEALTRSVASAQAAVNQTQRRITQRVRENRPYRSLLAERARRAGRAVELGSQLRAVEEEIGSLRSQHRERMDKEVQILDASLGVKRESQAFADSTATASMKQTSEAADRSYTANFVSQLDALGRLTSERFSTMWWVSVMIVALFLVIETAPILVKLLAKKGSYDEIIETEEEAVRVAQAESKRALEELHREKNKLTVDHDLAVHKEVLALQAKAEVSLAEKILEQWSQDELAKTHRISGDGAPELSVPDAERS